MIRLSRHLNAYVALALGLGCLLLALAFVAIDFRNRTRLESLQGEIAAVQAEMQRVAGVERFSQAILNELGAAAATNVDIRVLLARHGYSLPGGGVRAPGVSAENIDPGMSALLPPESTLLMREEQP